jgi:signal transduction histidine kinase/CheY-like chemotaxis protein/ligand-binding sensor domain-containing protein
MTGSFKIIILLSFLLLMAASGSSSNMKFYNVNDLFGISIREANSVCKDDKGFIWASSKTGILRLTEDDYRIYQLPYNSANIITVKLNYFKEQLIAYTNNGQIFVYNRITDRFDFLVNLSKELNNNFLSVNSLVTNNDGNTLYLTTSSGLMRFRDQQITLLSEQTGTVLQAIRYNEHQLIYSNNKGIHLFDTEAHVSTPLFQPEQLPFFNVSKLYLEKKENRLWIGTLSNGLYYYDFDENRFAGSGLNLPKQPILAIESISDTTMLIGIDGQGLWETDHLGSKILNVYKDDIDNPLSLRGNGVYDIFCDLKGKVWITTYSGGISYFDRTSPIVNQVTHLTNNPNSLVNNDVNCVIQDRNGNLWMATNNGISCWNMQENTWKSYFVNKQEQAQVFLTLCEDHQGRIWAGTYSSGVYIIDSKTGRQLAHYSQQVKDSPFVNDFVFSLYRDSSDDIWIGGINSEVIRYENATDRFRKYSFQPINVLTELSKGVMLFGCTYGLIKTNKETGEVNTLIDNCLVHDILVLDSIVWIGTSGDGLIRYNHTRNSSEKFTVHHGLPSNFVNSVTYANGYLWLGTENGLCRFDPIQKSALVYAAIPSLASTSFNRNSHFELSNGQLAWGTNKGVVIFNPKTLEQLPSLGKIYLQDISISGRSIRDIQNFRLDEPVDQLEKLTLHYNQNTIALEMLPIGVAAGSKFSWMLEGLDEDWSQPANHRVLSYTNIPSKTYNLKIRMYDNALSQILAERTLTIKVTPPFWGTSWFLIVVFLIITAIIYFSFWYYISLLKQRHTEEKVSFFTNTAHDLRTSLTLIKAPIEELGREESLSAEGLKNIRLAGEQAHRLTAVVTQLMDFQKIDIGKEQLSLSMNDAVEFVRQRLRMFESLAARKALSFSFNSTQKTFITAFDQGLMEKVVDNLISNAIKYAHPQTIIQVNLDNDEKEWSFEIKDEGIGISKKAQRQLFREFYRGENAVNSKIVGSGIGLLLVKKYVNLHGGEVSFTSQENMGSQFRFVLPINAVEPEVIHKAPLIENDSVISDNEQEEGIARTAIQSGFKVLLVEDNDDLLRFMQTALKTDFEVYIAADGQMAWNLIRKIQPDLVVSDVMMPGMDGFELCRLIKSTFETAHIPLVLLTALSGKTEQLNGLGLGADDYLTKPFDLALLRQKIKTIIMNRQVVRDKALKLFKTRPTESILNNEMNDKFVKNMLDVVKTNISNPQFNKEDFASAMNVSSSLLYKKVKALTDQSPSDFIKTVRLDHALELLQSRQYNVTEVSELCGFSSIGYFSTVFKKHFGSSPTEI